MRFRIRASRAAAARTTRVALSLALPSTGHAQADHRIVSDAKPDMDPKGLERSLLDEAVNPVAGDPAAARAWIDRVLSATPGQRDPFAAVDLCMQQEMAAEAIPGGSLAIAIDGEIAHTRAIGVKHIEEGGVVDERTLFRIGSITKMMTAAGIMQQVERGHLDLDDPITQFFQELRVGGPWPAQRVSLRHLLSHTSAYPDYYGPDNHQSFDAWIADQAGVSLMAPPGTFFNYSNPNYALAGAVLEQAAGTEHSVYVRDQLWQPIGMSLTTFEPSDVLAHGNYTTGHNGAARYAPDDLERGFRRPAGAAFSTPSEMVRWASTLMDAGGEILAPESVEAMTSSHVIQYSPPWSFYGYGVDVTDWQRVGQPYPRVEVLSHTGLTSGHYAILYWVPELGIAVAATLARSAGWRGATPSACASADFRWA